MAEPGGAPASATDRDDRLEYFDRAIRYTPFLAVEAAGALFLVRTVDKHVGRSLFAKRGRGDFGVLRRAVRALEGLGGTGAIKGRGFVDVGANIGTTTIAALMHGFGRAVAIEPEPDNVQVLRLNVLLNDAEAHVDVLPIAASDETGQAELVVDPERSGMHWIVTGPDRLELARGQSESRITAVETDTLDHLVATGPVDPEATGLLWLDAEGHEGQILHGASSLLERGIPLVLELNPAILERLGDPSRLHEAIVEHYTHFADMHAASDPEEARFPLHAVNDLPAYSAKFLEPGSPVKTDVLLLRLTSDQATRVRALDELVE